jgi:hypothetical protein
MLCHRCQPNLHVCTVLRKQWLEQQPLQALLHYCSGNQITRRLNSVLHKLAILASTQGSYSHLCIIRLRTLLMYTVLLSLLTADLSP